MKASAEVKIKGAKEDIWEAITDIKSSEKFISGIKKIEVLEKPSDGIVGFKWRETRVMFGKEATEIMWITEAEKNKFYKTRAESHGAIYRTLVALEEISDGCLLRMEFDSEAVGFLGKLMNLFFGGMMAKSTKKMVFEDLTDIKKFVEGKIK
jgi:hypothetical protein